MLIYLSSFFSFLAFVLVANLTRSVKAQDEKLDLLLTRLNELKDKS